MMKQLRITVGQINPSLGDLNGNLELMRAAAQKAQSDGADVIVFPELALTGYSPGDLLDDKEFAIRLAQATIRLRQLTRETPYLVWIVGLPMGRRTAGGKRFFNSLHVINNGKLHHVQHKQLLPTYGVFDERRHFEPGPDVAGVVCINDIRIGLLLCEDQWNDDGHDYPVNPFARLAQALPDVVISINASPSHVGKRKIRHEIIGKACARHKLPLLYVAQVGGHDQLVYDGASFAVDTKGKVVFEAARFASEIQTIAFNTKTRSFQSTTGGALPTVTPDGLPDMEFYRQQIVLGLRDYARRCGFSRVMVGSSGGIDSALTIALAAEALGAENVTAITMPSVFSSTGSVSDSVRLCENLGVELIHMPIRTIVDEFSSTMNASVGVPPYGLALENLQARIRGTLLMTYSNQYGHLLLTTGNKSEISVGYCTLYGDTNGGLGLIGDLYKTEVFELCRHLNAAAGRELIPVAIIDKPPSAELAPGQQDTDSLPPYEVLDDILKLYIEGDLLEPTEHARAKARVTKLEKTSKGRETIQHIQQLIARSEYKRRQAPPIIRVRARAFGTGRQVPITAVQY